MNQLQKTEFALLVEFIDICKKLKLQYYLICGSALGAAKYKGFIPWDDDIDVALPRKDYDIFVEKAPDMLPKHCFLQNIRSEKNCTFFCSKLRDIRTTYIERDQKDLDICHGVFIDVIPLDDLPDDKFFQKKYRIFRICQLVYLESNEKYKNIIKSILKKFINIRSVYFLFEKYLKKYPKSKLNQYCNFHNSKNVLAMDRDVYGRGSKSVFEGIEVIIPEKYDHYLTQYYGDWRSDPPEEEQVGHHYYSVCDVTKPYTEYIKRKQ